MTGSKPSPGDITESRCTRCKAPTNHTIVAMVEGHIVRVQCNTCNGVHNYHKILAPRKAAAPAAGKVATPRTPKVDPLAAERQEWASLRPTMRTERAIAYAMTTRFKVNDIVDHPSFGLGLVKRLVAPNKVEILFADGIKLLRCQ